MSDFIYLYGFVPADASPPADLAGINESAVAVVTAGGVRAVVSHVPSAAYQPALIEQQLQNLAWVAEQGVAHERVVAWFVDHAEIVPAPLFTLYSSEAALQSALAPRADSIASELQRLHNKREWDLKVSFDERAVEAHAAALSPRIAELEQQAESAGPGKRYLLIKQRNDLLKTETRQAAQRIAREVLDTLSELAVDTAILPIPKTVDELPVILHAALLVERPQEADLVQQLEQQAARLEGLGMGLSFSGPWAPYRFTGEHGRVAAG